MDLFILKKDVEKFTSTKLKKRCIWSLRLDLFRNTFRLCGYQQLFDSVLISFQCSNIFSVIQQRTDSRFILRNFSQFNDLFITWLVRKWMYICWDSFCRLAWLLQTLMRHHHHHNTLAYFFAPPYFQHDVNRWQAQQHHWQYDSWLKLSIHYQFWDMKTDSVHRAWMTANEDRQATWSLL